MTYNATDSVLRRHYDQHLSIGGAELAGSTDEGMRMAGTNGNRASAVAGAGAAAGASANDSRVNRDAQRADSQRSTNADRDYAGSAEDGKAKSSGGLGFLKILIPVAILGLLAWGATKFMGKDAAMDSSSDTATSETSDLGGQFSEFFGSTTETLEGITDADSATAALPNLESAKSSLEGLTGMLSGADDSAKEAAAGALKTGMESLAPAVEKLQGDSGIWGVLEPILGPMMETLKGMMG